MGIFDRMFGRGADKAEEHQDTFNELKSKYHTVLGTIEQQDVQLQNLHVQDGKLFIRGTAPSEEAKNRVWDQIKLVDSDYSDLSADISVNPSLGVTSSSSSSETYTVQSGDTLSEISQKYYGDSNEYMRIYYANRDKLSDPDKIQVGQQLVIPADDN